MKKLQIFEEDLTDGMQEVIKFAVDYDGEMVDQDRVKKIVLDIFRAGVFRGTQFSGGVIIEDKTNPTTIWQRIKYILGVI